MKNVISIIKPDDQELLLSICENMRLHSLVIHGHGTASPNILDSLKIESRERRLVMAVVDEERLDEYIHEQRRKLYIDAPGNGIVVALPIKSIGGGKTLAYLNGENPPQYIPVLNCSYEMIVVIANEGHADEVMDAARAAGARGGTVLHGKGTGSKNPEKFFNISISREEEVILIVAKATEKAAIMKSILKLAGPDTESGAILFSLPVSDIAGFGLMEE